ncbi:MAG: hypothetical protein KGV44_01535 [Flavobacteriaceae bacterium]|nr:hypothetical protein [Flavobacteriaceae bacterium]
MRKITLLLLIFVVTVSKAQSLDRNKGFSSIIQFSLMKNYKASNEIYTKGKGYKNYKLDVNNANAYSLNCILGYFVIPKMLSVGVGFGLDGYHNPNFNSAPLYLDARIFLMESRNSPYMYLDFGGLVKLSSAFEKGLTAKIGWGYKFFTSDKICLNASVGFDAKGVSLTDEAYQKSDNIIEIKGVTLTIGATLF